MAQFEARCSQAYPLGAQYLGQLQDVLVRHLLPRLSVQALQSLSQCCAAGRRAVRGQIESPLLGYAQVLACMFLGLSNRRSGL